LRFTLVLDFRLLVLLVLRAGGLPGAFFTALRVAAAALTGFAATFCFAGFATTFFFAGFPFAAGFALPLAGARAAGRALLAVLRLAVRVLAAEEAGLVFAEVLALLAGRFAASMK
jgi:hypothetical protein